MRVGFCCKWIGDEVPNTRTTTVAWLNRQTVQEAEARLEEIMLHNIAATAALVAQVGMGRRATRMLRLSSDILPMYTEPKWGYFYQRPDVQMYLQNQFATIGNMARMYDVRLSFHPGQFTVLASHNPDIVTKSIAEFEYHCDMIRWMGYGQEFQDFKCNVHISGREGAQGIINVLPRLSDVARNVLTIENSETTWGIEESLKLVDHCALVLDVHHHWVKTGEYIYPDDPRVERIVDSWRGVRPVIHYSSPREEILNNYDLTALPNHPKLLADGHTRAALRAHGDYYINQALNYWASLFLPTFDIQTESKMKNVSRDHFLESSGILTSIEACNA